MNNGTHFPVRRCVITVSVITLPVNIFYPMCCPSFTDFLWPFLTELVGNIVVNTVRVITVFFKIMCLWRSNINPPKPVVEQ